MSSRCVGLILQENRTLIYDSLTMNDSKNTDDALNKAHTVSLARRLSAKHLETDGLHDSTVKVESKAKPTKTKLAGWKHFIAGGVAGACEVLATMPLDVIKTQMQINPGRYSGIANAFTSIAREGGAKALYYGMPAFLTQTSAKAAIRFLGFSQCKEITTRIFPSNPNMANLFAGFGAGAFEAAIWTTPTERLKVLRQTEANKTGPTRYNSMLGTTRIVIAEQGITGLFVGLIPTVLRQASSVGVRFLLYEPVKTIITSASGQDEGVATFMMAGGTVGALSVAFNNPVDVIKNIQQSGHKGSMMSVSMEIYQSGGVQGFYRGLTARVPRVFAGQAITFAVYENMAALLVNI